MGKDDRLCDLERNNNFCLISKRRVSYFLMLHLRILKKCISFHDVGVSSRDRLNDVEEGIDQPESVKHEEEKYNYHEKDNDESSIKMNDHQMNDLLGFITRYTFGYFVKVKSGNIELF